MSELSEDGDVFIAARGGAGGHGNRFYLSNEHRAPAVAEEGGKGETILYHVELRIMANVGLVSAFVEFPCCISICFCRLAFQTPASPVFFAPSPGQDPKSPLIHLLRCSRILEWLNTRTILKSLVRIFDLVKYSSYDFYLVADIPGLVPGAHENAGVGFDFLRHIERCACLVYVIDLSWGDEPWRQIESLNVELEEYKSGLSTRPSMVIANKIDLPPSQERYERLKSWTTLPVFPVSAKYRQGIIECLIAIRQFCDEHSIRFLVSSDVK